MRRLRGGNFSGNDGAALDGEIVIDLISTERKFADHRSLDGGHGVERIEKLGAKAILRWELFIARGRQAQVEREDIVGAEAWRNRSH